MAIVDNNTPSKGNPSMGDKPWGVDASANKNKTFTLQSIFNLFKVNLDSFYAGVDTIFRKDQADAIYAKINDTYTKSEVDQIRNASFMGGANTSTVPNEELGAQFWQATQSGFYTNMDNLEVDLSDGVTYLNFDGTTWTKSTSPIDVTNKADKSEVQKAVEFSDISVVQGKNLIDISLAITNSYYSYGSGSIGSLAGWTRMPYIEILPNALYTVSGIDTSFVGNIYDASFTRIQTLGTNIGQKNQFTFTSGPTAMWLGVNIGSLVGSNFELAQLELGSKTSYQPYSLFVTENKIEGERSVELFNTETLFIKSYNLADAFNIVPNSYYSFSTGAITSSVDRRRLPYIEVLPNTAYAISGVNTDFIGNEYDENYNQISPIGNTVIQRSSFLLTTSPTTKYLGINVSNQGGTNTEYDSSVQVTQTESIVEYQKPGLLLKQSAIFPSIDISGSVLPNVFYQYVLTDTSFYVYVKSISKSDRYIRYQLKHETSTPSRADLWRVRLAAAYIWNGSTMTPESINILTGGESEFTFLENGKSDYTGGFHGDEELISASFFADGLPISTGADIPLIAAGKFHYIQRSEMLETDNATRTVIAVHDKETRFLNGGYKTINRITWSLSRLIDICYFGIASVDLDSSDYFMADNSVTINSNQNGVEKINQSGGARIWYWNGVKNISIFVESHITKAKTGSVDSFKEYDNGCNMVVWDANIYAKYYRRLEAKTPVIGEVWEGEMIFEI